MLASLVVEVLSVEGRGPWPWQGRRV